MEVFPHSIGKHQYFKQIFQEKKQSKRALFHILDNRVLTNTSSQFSKLIKLWKILTVWPTDSFLGDSHSTSAQ